MRPHKLWTTRDTYLSHTVNGHIKTLISVFLWDILQIGTFILLYINEQLHILLYERADLHREMCQVHS